MRLDLYMVKNSMVGGRDRAKELILEGKVEVSGKVIKKPSFDVENEDITLLESDLFVGRGALKLKKAMEIFNLSAKGKICLDAGASTGGFTEIMLLDGAEKVYAVDVGEGQLSEKLKSDGRVVNLEKTDIRNLALSEKADFFTADVSFISLKQILKPLFDLTGDSSSGVCLIKPQFEAGRSFVGKKGVVKDKKVHVNVIYDIIKASEALGFSASGLTYSPVKGQNGNIEYLIFLEKGGKTHITNVEEIVKKSWEELSQ